ncbi:hypothetical protein LZ017_16970 [Pelomonas sp. CA6]|uniref:FliH/SctL family protein n=1 Tax=Pelomonas sp. CA6 TaxID=2907999 RepID=UPI001F4C0D3B|nr:FliH/SctL family protein [Pelomonas sp. CA6]MCH7345077.1 hypothetical protein [Pelomonas sp. CA6]
MNYLLWHGEGLALSSSRRLFSPDEVRAFDDVHALCACLIEMTSTQAASAEEARAQAAAEGWRQGLDEGRREGLALARQVALDALAAAAKAADTAGRASQSDVALLALQVARKLIGQLPEAEQLARLAREAARQALPDAPDIVLRVPAAQEQAVRALLDDGRDLRWSVVGDAALPAGGCHLAGPHGEVDAALESQLGRLASAWGLNLNAPPGVARASASASAWPSTSAAVPPHAPTATDPERAA